MKFTINKDILERYPNLNLGLVVVRDIDNSGGNQEIFDLLRKIENEIRKNFDSETLPQQPKIRTWQEIYSSFGAKPKKYRCSVENLYRIVLDGIEIRHINKLVDIYNYISLKHMVPLGGDDLDKVDGSIELRFAKGDEIFIELESDEIKNPKSGEVIYADDKEVLCRRWNWRECNKSKMTEQTTNAAIVVEGLSSVTKDSIGNITKELSELIKKYCGGSFEIYILNTENPTIEIQF